MELNMNVSSRFVSFVNDWDYEQYLCVGGYGSGKSYAIAQKIILKLLQEKRTCLVVRNVFDTMRESCFQLLKDVLQKSNMLADSNYRLKTSTERVVAVTSPMEIRFPNGSRIIFRGMDNPEKLKSIHGVSIVWMEECTEITRDAYIELLGRIRELGKSLHFIMSCNPVGKESWVYQTFFVRTETKTNKITGEQKVKETVIQEPNEFYKRRTLINPKNGIYYHHSIPDDNPFLPSAYIRRLDGIKEIDAYLWIVARYGRFGAVGTRVLPRFEVAKNARAFKEAVNRIPSQYHFFGLDFGFEESYNALISCCVDDANKYLYIYDEVYVNHVTDDIFSKRPDVQRAKQRAERCNKPIVADSAEPKAIKFYRQEGFTMTKCTKFPGSRLSNTRKLKRFKKIICSPKCANTIRELKDLTYKKNKNGTISYDEFNIDPHTLSALWYALDNYEVADIKELKSNSRAG